MAPAKVATQDGRYHSGGGASFPRGIVGNANVKPRGCFGGDIEFLARGGVELNRADFAGEQFEAILLNDGFERVFHREGGAGCKE